ncbi:MAG: PfkB family carbohydrate kinase [Candidatus Hodarchaeales archaeon]
MASYSLVIGKISYNLTFSLSQSPCTENNLILEASDVKRDYSGLAANIAYGIAILGGQPILTSVVGKDFDLYYKDHLENSNVILRLFYDDKRESACVYNILTPESDVFTIVQNNSYRFFAEKDVIHNLVEDEKKNLSVVFIGTGIIEADAKFVTDIYKFNAKLPLIYSPNLDPKSFVKWRLNQILEKISILVCRESELVQFEKLLGLGRQEIIEKFNRLKYIFTIHDRSKIVIHSKDIMTKISEAPAENVVSDKGWFDAFRAGLVYAVSLKKPIIEAAKIASALASYSIEKASSQIYNPSPEQVSLRAFEVKVISKNL